MLHSEPGQGWAIYRNYFDDNSKFENIEYENIYIFLAGALLCFKITIWLLCVHTHTHTDTVCKLKFALAQALSFALFLSCHKDFCMNYSI